MEPGRSPGSGRPSRAQGSPGPAGKDGASGYEIVSRTEQLLLNESNLWTGNLAVSCPSGKQGIGGGGLANQSCFAFMTASAPSGAPSNGWRVSFRDDPPVGDGSYVNSVQVTVYAVCANV